MDAKQQREYRERNSKYKNKLFAMPALAWNSGCI